jgi:hypothetical protein
MLIFQPPLNFIIVKITKPSTVFILNNNTYYLVIKKKTQGISIFAIKKLLNTSPTYTVITYYITFWLDKISHFFTPVSMLTLLKK